MSPPACWGQAIEEIIFKPLGLQIDALYLWDEEGKQDLLTRNPLLEARQYLHRPYLHRELAASSAADT